MNVDAVGVKVPIEVCIAHLKVGEKRDAVRGERGELGLLGDDLGEANSPALESRQFFGGNGIKAVIIESAVLA